MSRITERTAKKTKTGLSGTRKNGLAAAAGTGRNETSSAPAYGSNEHIMAILDMLDGEYANGSLPADVYATGEPLDGLILTLLSQNTNDRNRDMAYEKLRSECPSWSDVASLSVSAIASLIKPAGLGDTKSSRMKEILKIIKNDFNDYSLRGMMGWEREQAKEYLSRLPGIGPKTAACVLVFDLGMPAFPVDTHVARISRRVGWVREKETPEKIQDFLESEVPPDRCRGGHLNMIDHGRKTCRSRKPDCESCVIRNICKYYLDSSDNI